MSEVTFVTAFITLKVFEGRTIEWRMNHFDRLVQTGIHLCVYGDDTTLPILKEYAKHHSNVIVFDMDYKSRPIYKMCDNSDFALPPHRSLEKDTPEFMKVMNSKIEFVHDTIEKNPWNSSVFAWIDFSIAYIFKNMEKTLDRIKYLGTAKYVDKFFVIPGCHSTKPQVDVIDKYVCWRFCGGFFMGDKMSLERFYELTTENLPKFFAKFNMLMWEVNFWAWLELTTDWNPSLYLSVHDDSMLNVPQSFIET